MRVREVMTEDVLTIGPEAPLKDVAKILVEHGVSGLPVCDIEGHVVGVISEGDILYKEHDPTEGHVGGPLGWLVDGSPNVRGAARPGGHGREGDDVAGGDDPALRVGRAGGPDHVRAPGQPAAGRQGRQAGRHRHARRPRPRVHAHGRGVERELREDVLARTMWVEPGRVELEVRNGVVTLTGRLHTRTDAELLDRLAGGSRRALGRLGRALGDRRHDAQGPARDRAAGPMTQLSHAFEIEQVRRQLEAGDGGYEVVHTSPGLEVGVYVLVAPEPDHQQPHADDELYVVLEGSGVLNVEGEAIPVAEGQSVFVPAGAVHQFTAYEGLSVLVIFARTGTATAGARDTRPDAQSADFPQRQTWPPRISGGRARLNVRSL